MDWSRLDIRKRCNPQAGQLVRSNCPKTVTNKVGQRSHPRCTECTRTCPSGWAHFHNDYKNAGSSMASGAVERDGARRPKKIKCHHWKRPPFVSIICQSNPTHTLHSWHTFEYYTPLCFISLLSQDSQQNAQAQVTLFVSRANDSGNRPHSSTSSKLKFRVWTLTYIKGLITGLVNGTTLFTLYQRGMETLDVMKGEQHGRLLFLSHNLFSETHTKETPLVTRFKPRVLWIWNGNDTDTTATSGDPTNFTVWTDG